MSRLHALQSPLTDVARYFDVVDSPVLTAPAQVVEGNRGIVIFEVDGRRLIRSMRWGFPRRAHAIDEPSVLGLVADLTNPMWEKLVVEPRYRCIIPITHFGNPDGEPGEKTRTWFSVKDEPFMAWAGFCQRLPDAGPCYAGMTMEANAAIPPTNDRMPALLERDELDHWFNGSIQDVIAFQFRRPIDAERMVVIRTDDAWRSGAPPPAGTQGELL